MIVGALAQLLLGSGKGIDETASGRPHRVALGELIAACSPLWPGAEAERADQFVRRRASHHCMALVAVAQRRTGAARPPPLTDQATGARAAR